MDVSEQIRKFEEFFNQNYKKNILTSVSKGNNFVIVDFRDLLAFDTKIAEELLRTPEEVIKASEHAITSLDIPAETEKFRVRFKNVPETQKIMINELRSEHLGRLLTIEGIVRRKSDVRPKATASKFECPNCGNIIQVLQVEETFREPTSCGCGRKGKFKLIDKDFVDAQSLVLEENPDELEGGEQPKKIHVFLKEDLVSPITEKRTNPGSKVVVVGIMKEVPVVERGKKSTRFELILEANYTEATEDDFYQIEITKEEQKEIIELSKDPDVFQKLANSVAPSVYGYERIKDALLLQLLGGVHKKRYDGTSTRGDSHILLVGDPGAGKSQILKRISAVAPKGRYVAGKGSSGAGLTAAVVRDDVLGGWSLEAGALVLSNNGMVSIDEMDKMTEEDRATMHEALEQQSISIAKASIQATLSSKTTVLAAANPKLGRFDPNSIMAEQIDMPPTLINRFDLIFPIKDMPNVENDKKLASHILQMHKKSDVGSPEIPTELFKKYIAYARQNCSPKLTDEASEEIEKFYVNMRNKEKSDERAARSIPISPRQLDAIVRLAEAHAKSRLAEKVTVTDAKKAIDLIMYYLEQVGIDQETGQFDIDRISTGMGASQRSRFRMIMEIIEDLEEGKKGKPVPIEKIQESAKEKGMKEIDIDDNIQRLKKNGDIYEPRQGHFARM